MSAQESWKAAYRELLAKIVQMGYPEEFGKAIARNLGSEKTMRRMTAYLYSAKPRSAEKIADEMLAYTGSLMTIRCFHAIVGSEINRATGPERKGNVAETFEQY